MINLFNIPDLIEKSAASDIEIQAVENRMNVTLPNVYKGLLRCTNGFSIGSGLLIYGTEHIAERNEVWEVDEYARGMSQLVMTVGVMYFNGSTCRGKRGGSN